MYHCPDHPDCVMWPSGGGGYTCVFCRRTETEDFLRGPPTPVHHLMIGGGRLTLEDRCLVRHCTSVSWRLVDGDPTNGRTSRRCAASHCYGDWPEVPSTGGRCFWCGCGRTVRIPRYNRPTVVCHNCNRTWRGVDPPVPFMQHFYAGDRPWAGATPPLNAVWTEMLNGQPIPVRQFPWIDLTGGDL